MTKPLSFAQERLWWSGEAAPASINVPMAMRLDGAISIAALEQTLSILVERHPLLRTRFRISEGIPVQEALTSVRIEIPLIDLQGLTAESHPLFAEELLRTAAERPLDLSSPPLFRPYLFRLAPCDHLLLVRLSHLIVDERSRHLLMEEIAMVYAALSAAEPLNLPPLHAKYGDYALWERTPSAGYDFQKHLDFWGTYLADLPTLLELPLDHPRPPARSFRGAWRTRLLEAPIGHRMRALARAEGVTLFQMLLASVFVLLARYTGSQDIALGTPFSYPPDQRYARIVGPFLNSLVVRADCSKSPTFREFVQHVRSRMAAALAHATVPFEKVLDHLHVERDASYNPLIQVWFVYREKEVSTVSWGGPKVTPIEWHETAMPFDITLTIADRVDSFNCSCTYDTALFEPETIERLLDQFGRLLSSVIEEPNRCIEEYDLLSPSDYRRQMTVWNDTAVAWKSPACVYDAILAVAERMPDAIAISSDAGEMTYGALASSARGLASRLRDAGVSFESRVAIVMARSLNLIVSLVAVLEAGGAYVPIDPGASRERMQSILHDAGATCVLTTAAFQEKLPDTNCPVILADKGSAAPAETLSTSRDAGSIRPQGENLCYVLYTSGTTGEPKGVAITHAAVMNLLESFAQALEVAPGDTMLAIAPITFDIATLEIFLPLIRGARVAIAPEHTAADGANLRARLTDDRVTLLQATPATWRLLVDAGWQASPGIRIISGAEPLPAELARQLIATAGHVWNCYGPTETTIYSTFERISSENDPITIGRPMANTSIYVLDRNQRPVPVGVQGEIYLAGDGLARGYLGQPGLTAAAFRPDPFNPRPGSRMYASGDLGRFHPDGRIACDGRRDYQVKINGRRIELEAISRVLDSHPLVRSSIVVRQVGASGPYLVAYVASAAPQEIERAGLREHLTRHLPSYMVPSAFVLLDALPKTPRGKLDRRGLPPPAESDFHCASSQASARTPSEETIAAIWREVLPMQTIGVEDDFFALGGNSLQVTRVLQMIRAALGVELSVNTFFEAPTIASLAQCVDQERQAVLAVERGVVTPLPRSGHLDLAPQQENWWYNEFLTGNIQPNNIHFGLSIIGPLSQAGIEQSVALLQRRHEAFRTAFVANHSGGAAVVITPEENCAIDILQLDLSHLPVHTQPELLRRISQQEKNRPFDLARGNLCRVVLARLGAENHVVMFTVHHLVFDEWSMDIVMRDVSAVYADLTRGAPPELPALAFQYADFAKWQRDWLSSPGAAKQFSFWRQHLAPPLPPLLAATDDEDESHAMGFAIRGRIPFIIGAEAAEPARRIARSEKVTLFSTVMAVVKLVLYAYSQQTDLRVGTLIANRDLPGARDIVGLFTNVVCLRLRIDPSSSFRKLLRVEHATIGDATANQDLPFEIVVRDLQASQKTARATVLQALVVWLTMPAQDSLHFTDITTSAYRSDQEEGDSVVLARSTLDVRFEFAETPTVITGNITYNMSKFTSEDIHLIAESMTRCFGLAERNRDASLAELREELLPQMAAVSGSAPLLAACGSGE